jgi:hypothetical protein
VVRYFTGIPLSNPTLQILPTIFGSSYIGYIAGAHEWSVVVPPYYSGLASFKVFDGNTFIAQCDVIWSPWGG